MRNLPQGAHLAYWRANPDTLHVMVVRSDGSYVWQFPIVRDGATEFGEMLSVQVYRDGFAAFRQAPEVFAALSDPYAPDSLDEVEERLKRLGAVEQRPQGGEVG
ncbi:hypothetical protein [Nonomuraea sp. NPDC050202]|uniref:hypothetical protein n=1 Tax=Nonomuraea sp. NPDC050202 TaxID=3155035 RepID=UPI0033C061FC